MRIRNKLQVLLLAIALLPLVALTAFFLYSGRQTGLEIAAQAEQALMERARAYLREKVADQAGLIRDRINLVELALEVQAEAVAKALAAPPPVVDVVTRDDVDSGQALAVERDGYFRLTAAGQREPVPVVPDAMVIGYAPGVDPAGVSDDARRVGGLLPAFAETARVHAGIVLWQYVSLANGVHAVFPGHGGMEADYDGRSRPWYAAARAADGTVWLDPMADATTGRFVFTAARAVRYPDDSFAGVTAIDVPADAVLRVRRVAPAWAAGLQLVLATRQAQGAVEVSAQAASTPASGPGPTGLSIARADAAVKALFDQAWETGDAVLGRGAHQGVDAIWAVMPVAGAELAVALVLPREQIVAALASTRESVLAASRWQSQVAAAAFLAIALLVIVIAGRAARRVTEPLAELATTAGRIANGRLDSRAQVETGDEIGELGHSLNTMAASIERLQTEQEEAYLQMMQVLYKALAAKDAYTASHSGRVTQNSLRLGERIGLDPAQLDVLRRGAQMHDLGKIGIPDAILNKPEPLSDAEFEEMKRHPEYTAAIMRPLRRFQAFADIAAWHHERWDGAGYPDGLRGEQIPLLARIVAIADTWDAMTGDRVYRKGMARETALGILERERNSGQWDPDLLHEFMAMIREEMAEAGESQASETGRQEA